MTNVAAARSRRCLELSAAAGSSSATKSGDEGRQVSPRETRLIAPISREDAHRWRCSAACKMCHHDYVYSLIGHVHSRTKIVRPSSRASSVIPSRFPQETYLEGELERAATRRNAGKRDHPRHKISLCSRRAANRATSDTAGMLDREGNPYRVIFFPASRRWEATWLGT